MIVTASSCDIIPHHFGAKRKFSYNTIISLNMLENIKKQIKELDLKLEHLRGFL